MQKGQRVCGGVCSGFFLAIDLTLLQASIPFQISPHK